MYQRILVPIDESPTSERGLDVAIELAKVAGGSLRLVHVLDELVFPVGFAPGTAYDTDILPALKRSAHAVLDKAKARVTAAGVRVDCVLAECFGTRTAEVVIAQAKEWNADVIVIGTHGRRGVGRLLLGSDAEQVLRSASVPVLLVRGDEGAPRRDAATSARDSSPRGTTS